jgi:hypothetical protein
LPPLTAVEGSEVFPQVPEKETLLSKKEKERERERKRERERESWPERSTIAKPW